MSNHGPGFLEGTPIKDQLMAQLEQDRQVILQQARAVTDKDIKIYDRQPYFDGPFPRGLVEVTEGKKNENKPESARYGVIVMKGEQAGVAFADGSVYGLFEYSKDFSLETKSWPRKDGEVTQLIPEVDSKILTINAVEGLETDDGRKFNVVLLELVNGVPQTELERFSKGLSAEVKKLGLS